MSAAPHRSILVTGGMGFIGSHFVRLALQRWPGCRVVNYDALTYAANPRNVADVADHPCYTFVQGDVRDPRAVLGALRRHDCDAIVHFAAESHVDRSILDSDDTMTTNVIGTHVLLQAALAVGLRRFLLVSTDEVYGSIDDPLMADEDAPLRPSSPYAVSKASADLLVRTYHVTYGLPTLISRGSNTFGPSQYPEKLIPLFIERLLAGDRVPVYGDGLNVRDWIHVADHCAALATLLDHGRPGMTYNIAGHCPLTNLDITRRLLTLTDRDDAAIDYVADRAGHDRRYAMDTRRIESDLNWRAAQPFDQSLAHTVAWYRAHSDWWTDPAGPSRPGV